MMAAEKKSRNHPNKVGWLSDNQALPNAGDGDSANMVDVSPYAENELMISIYANTDIDIAGGQVFYIELEGYSADTSTSADSFYTKDNNQGDLRGTGTLMQEGHMYLFHKSATDGAVDFNAGDLIYEGAVPSKMLKLAGYTHIQLKYTTDADESDETIDAFVWAIP